jgi:hypothetical protein
MRAQDLAAMLNQLAAHHGEAGRAEAVAILEDIVARAWDSRMRARLAACLEEGGAELSEIAYEAARRICGDA